MESDEAKTSTEKTATKGGPAAAAQKNKGGVVPKEDDLDEVEEEVEAAENE